MSSRNNLRRSLLRKVLSNVIHQPGRSKFRPQLERLEARQLLAADLIVNGSFESYTGPKGSIITQDVEGWRGVQAQTVDKDKTVDPDSLPDSDGIELWRKTGKKTYAGYNQIELDGRGNVVDGVYQKFSTTEPTNLMFAAYARQRGSSDVEVYIDGEYVETISPPTIKSKSDIRQAYFYALEAGEHSILFKEVNGQNNGRGAVIDNVRLVSDQMKAMLDSAGRHTHNFYEHVSDLYDVDLMAPGQTEYDAKGFEKVSETLYRGNSPITGLRPVIEEAIERELRRNPRLEGEALEAKIANRLTNLNDFSQLQAKTQDKLIEMTGIDFREMSKEQREKTINHLLHSPIPFGNIEEVLSPDVTIDLGYTHTLDKNWTRVGHLGEGVWKVWLISNNNNGSHTGHNLGEFKVQLTVDMTPDEARDAANAMVENQNNNNRLKLDEAAKDILYGVTPRLDPVDRDAPVNEGIVNGSFESYTGEKGSKITDEVEGWYGVRAQTVNREIGVDPDSLPDSDGIELWRKTGKKTYAGYNQIELDGRGNVVDGVYQKFSTTEPTNLMFAAYARQRGSSDVEVYIDGEYVETISPPTIKSKSDIRQAYFYALEAGEHSILFKEVNGQNNGRGAVIDNVRLVSDQMKAMLDSAGRHTHNFYEHVSDLYDVDLMAPGQTEYDAKGFEKVSETLYRGNSPITGLRPVIEEAIERELRRNPRLEGEALEAKIANRLTNLNDFSQLQAKTQDKLIEMTGIDFREMSKEQREKTINHLLHSPIPFGNIEEVLSPDVTIDLGYTHTLDKNWTRVGHLGEGVWKVWLISNNNNGSHTGHNLGEFKVQLTVDMTPDEARDAANAMVENQNNNNRLSLDEAAKAMLYGNGSGSPGSLADSLEAESLRRMIFGANSTEETDTITLQAGTYELSLRGKAHSGGDLDVSSHIVIVGQGPDQTTIDANAIDRVFEIHEGGTLELRDLTITGGKAKHGGGIFARGDLVLDNVILTENRSSREGGAIHVASGSTEIEGSTLEANSGRSGGAIYVSSDATLVVEESSLSGNRAHRQGGAIYSKGESLIVVGSSLAENQASREGGAIFVRDGSATFNKSTLNENSARDGGALYVHSGATVDIVSSSFAGNTASRSGGAILSRADSLSIANSTLTKNQANSKGGGIYSRGSTSISNSVLSENSGKYGGAIYNSAALTLTDSSLLNNSASHSGDEISQSGSGSLEATNLTLVDDFFASLNEKGKYHLD